MKDVTDQLENRIELRPVVLPDDEPFLQKLYASTRDDLTRFITDEALLHQLLQMQYQAQRAGMAAEFPAAVDQIIMLDGESVGRLMLDHRRDSIHGVDIAVMNRERNRGVGTEVLSRVFEHCANKGVYFTLNVAKNNPAMRLYERLGCRFEEDNGTHFLMTYRPNGSD